MTIDLVLPVLPIIALVGAISYLMLQTDSLLACGSSLSPAHLDFECPYRPRGPDNHRRRRLLIYLRDHCERRSQPLHRLERTTKDCLVPYRVKSNQPYFHLCKPKSAKITLNRTNDSFLYGSRGDWILGQESDEKVPVPSSTRLASTSSRFSRLPPIAAAPLSGGSA
jgi:hypothetical protein